MLSLEDEKDMLISGLMIVRQSNQDAESKVRWLNEMIDGYVSNVRKLNRGVTP
jgi:hypothetical protein